MVEKNVTEIRIPWIEAIKFWLAGVIAMIIVWIIILLFFISMFVPLLSRTRW